MYNEKQNFGKLKSEPKIAATKDSHLNIGKSPRLFVKDVISGFNFLVDTGSDVSVLPSKYFSELKPVDYPLRAVNGSNISVFGLVQLSADFSLRKKFKWNFLIADVHRAILGADFLKYHDLLPDFKKKALIHRDSLLSVNCAVRNTSQPSICSVSGNIHSCNDAKINALLAENQGLFLPPKYTVDDNNNNDKVYHYIETVGPPIYQKPRRLRPDIAIEVKNEFKKMCDIGICRPSSSQWASPIVPIKRDEKNSYYRRLP